MQVPRFPRDRTDEWEKRQGQREAAADVEAKADRFEKPVCEQTGSDMHGCKDTGLAEEDWCVVCKPKKPVIVERLRERVRRARDMCLPYVYDSVAANGTEGYDAELDSRAAAEIERLREQRDHFESRAVHRDDEVATLRQRVAELEKEINRVRSTWTAPRDAAKEATDG